MAPKALRHDAGIPKWMRPDDRQGFLSSLAVAANAIRKKQTELCVGRQAQRASILLDDLLVAAWSAELRAALCFSDARPKVPTYAESGRRDLRIKHDQIANDHRRNNQQG